MNILHEKEISFEGVDVYEYMRNAVSAINDLHEYNHGQGSCNDLRLRRVFL